MVLTNRATHELSFFLNPFYRRGGHYKIHVGGFRKPLYSVLRNFEGISRHFFTTGQLVIWYHVHANAQKNTRMNNSTASS